MAKNKVAKKQITEMGTPDINVPAGTPSKFVQFAQCDKTWLAGNSPYGKIPAGFAIGQKGQKFHWYRLDSENNWHVYVNGAGLQGFTFDPKTAVHKCHEWLARPGFDTNRYTHNACLAAAKGIQAAGQLAAAVHTAKQQTAAA